MFNSRLYNRVYQRQRKRRIRAEAVRRFGGRCVVCGSTDRLEFDHIDPCSKAVAKHDNIWSWSVARREAELVKCQLLCKLHHDIKTERDLGINCSEGQN